MIVHAPQVIGSPEALDFDEATHRYTLVGRRLLSVTQVLKSAGLIDDRWYAPGSAERGTFVAEAIALDNAGELDEAAVDPELAGYLAAWRSFRKLCGWEFIAVEQVVCAPLLGVAGRVDAAAVERGQDIIIDAKTGNAEKWHALQLCAYRDIGPWQNARLAAVYLTAEGKYRVDEIPPAVARNGTLIWRAAVTVAQWKVLHGID